MDYFQQKDDRYVSRGVPGLQSRSGAARFTLAALPLVLLAAIYFSSGSRGIDIKEVLPFLVIGSVFLFSSVLAGILAGRGHGSGVVVDQTGGTLSYRVSRGPRRTMGIADLKEIGIQMTEENVSAYGDGKGHALVYLLTADDRRVPLAFGKSTRELRQFADELSILTSLAVKEYSGGVS
ncbi:MAG: hypothetical protein AVO35_08320 [Candidatus Aegiribacteria sp. MLS_C]|nr:MAG: hypothetical protein AVO35_08320 [Candidatus Aegiribacteria sp. MLS_C]